MKSTSQRSKYVVLHVLKYFQALLSQSLSVCSSVSQTPLHPSSVIFKFSTFKLFSLFLLPLPASHLPFVRLGDSDQSWYCVATSDLMKTASCFMEINPLRSLRRPTANVPAKHFMITTFNILHSSLVFSTHQHKMFLKADKLCCYSMTDSHTE